MVTTSTTNIRSWSKQPNFKNWLALVLGSLFVAAWTLIRFFDQAANFDQVGQMVLAHQWLNGQHAGSVIGPTNYVLKILVLYIPIDFIHISAQLKLIVMTILINLATFIGIFFGLRLIWREFYKQQSDNFYGPILFLSLISGSVFWISFANSRNLEVAGGVLLIYLYLKNQVRPNRLSLLGFTAAASLLFFADPLQIYMSALPILIFVTARLLINRTKWSAKNTAGLYALTAVAAGLAKIIDKLVAHIWNVSFISNGQTPKLNASAVWSAAKQMARLYDGGYEAGHIRMVFNLLVILLVIVAAILVFKKTKASRPILYLSATFWVVDMGIYVLSGQAQQADTSRYLIMTVPALMLAMAASLKYLPAIKPKSYIVWLIIIINTLLLIPAFAKAWDPSISPNAHDRSVIDYLKAHHYLYVYASINTALASNYLSSWNITALPVGCDADHILKKTTIFFDKSGFSVSREQPNQQIPLVLDGNNITIAPTTCSTSDITKQLGQPQKIAHLSDGSMVIIYQARQFSALRSF